MKKITFFALALTCCATASGQDYWCLNKDFTLLFDYGNLNRDELHSSTIVKEQIVLADGRIRTKNALKTKHLLKCFGRASAARAGITYHASPCASLEALYTFVLPWHAKKTLIGADNLSFPFSASATIPGFVDVFQIDAKYRSWFQNGELNYWIHVTPQYVNYFSFSWAMGFRTIFLKEKFGLGFVSDLGNATYSVKTDNGLYGFQLGAMLEINPSRCWTWTFQIKGAAFANDAKNRVSIHVDSRFFETPHYSKNQLGASCLIEGYGQLAYHWTSFFNLHAGYQGFLLSGVALAPEQRALKLTKNCGIKDGGQVVIHGFYAGLTLSF